MVITDKRNFIVEAGNRMHAKKRASHIAKDNENIKKIYKNK